MYKGLRKCTKIIVESQTALTPITTQSSNIRTINSPQSEVCEVKALNTAFSEVFTRVIERNQPTPFGLRVDEELTSKATG